MTALPFHVTTSQGGLQTFATAVEAEREAERLSALYSVEAEAFDSRGLTLEGYDFQAVYRDGVRLDG